MSEINLRELDLFNPTEEHKMLRQMVREFTESEVEPRLMSLIRKKNLILNYSVSWVS